MPTPSHAQHRLVLAVYAALNKLWPMAPATRRATAEAIVHEIYSSGIRVELERRASPARRQIPPLVPVSLLLCTGYAVDKAIVTAAIHILLSPIFQ